MYTLKIFLWGLFCIISVYACTEPEQIYQQHCYVRPSIFLIEWEIYIHIEAKEGNNICITKKGELPICGIINHEEIISTKDDTYCWEMRWTIENPLVESAIIHSHHRFYEIIVIIDGILFVCIWILAMYLYISNEKEEEDDEKENEIQPIAWVINKDIY